MSSKTHRRKVRAQRRRFHTSTVTALDRHAEVFMQSLTDMLDRISQFATSDDPVADIDAALSELVDELTTRFCSIDPTRVIEVARLACLPWSHDGQVPAGSQKGPTQAELIALIAMTAHSGGPREDPNSDAGLWEEHSERANTGSTHPGGKEKGESDQVTKVVNEA
jgi:hypothetical protein